VLQKCDAPACINNCEWDFPKPTAGIIPAADGYYGIDGEVVVLLDESVAQVFFNGDVVTSLNRNCSSTAACLTINGGDALVHLDAWKMTPAGIETSERLKTDEHLRTDGVWDLHSDGPA
jgi:hypothetical protein